MSWLSNEPTNVGSLLFATNYWTSFLMHSWIWIFVTGLFSDLFCLFHSYPWDYQTNGARVRATGIVVISTQPLNRADTFCLTLFVWHFLSDTFFLPSLLPVVNCACAHKMVGRYDGAPPQNVFKIICQVFKPWCPYYTIRAQIYLINQPTILAVHQSWLLSFDCDVENSACCVIVHKNCGWALLPTHFFQGEA